MSELGQFNLIKTKKAFDEAKERIDDILGNLRSIVQKKCWIFRRDKYV